MFCGFSGKIVFYSFGGKIAFWREILFGGFGGKCVLTKKCVCRFDGKMFYFAILAGKCIFAVWVGKIHFYVFDGNFFIFG